MRRQKRPAFTLLQLLLVLVILLTLFALLLPAAVQARAKAERTKVFENLRELGIALHNYADTYTYTFPPGVDDNHFSAASRLLPFTDEGQVYSKIDFKKSIDDEANAEARKVKIQTFLSTSDPIESVKPEWGATNYLFNDKLFFLNSKARYPADLPDGTSNTILIGETLKGDGKTTATDVKRQYVLLKTGELKATGPRSGVKYFKADKNIVGDRCASWMDGRFLQGTFNGRLLPNDSHPDVSCGGISGVSAMRSFEKHVLVLCGDGSVRGISNTISKTTWERAIDPADGLPMGPDW